MFRELKEELGIDLKDLNYTGSKSDVYTYDGITFPTLNFIFSGKIVSQILKASDDISGFEFFEKDKLPYELLAFEWIGEALKELFINRK